MQISASVDHAASSRGQIADTLLDQAGLEDRLIFTPGAT
jgi:hypothetical protein